MTNRHETTALTHIAHDVRHALGGIRLFGETICVKGTLHAGPAIGRAVTPSTFAAVLATLGVTGAAFTLEQWLVWEARSELVDALPPRVAEAFHISLVRQQTAPIIAAHVAQSRPRAV